MKIISLSVENFMKLHAVVIEPDGRIIEITGKNAAGKTSALDSIWAVFEWAQASKSIKKPIREGEDRAEIRIDLDEFIATRTFTEKGTTLKIQSAEGATYPSPQAFVDKLKTSFSFDPLAFTNQSDKDQAATLRELVGIDTTKLDEERAELYEARANWNRQAKERGGALKTHAGADVPEDTPDAEVSVSELMVELEAAEGVAREAKERALDVQANRADIERIERHISELRKSLSLSEQEHSRLKKVDEERLQILKDLPETPDTDAIKARIANADETNMAVRAHKDYQLVKAQQFEAEDNADTLSEKMKDIDGEKKALVENAQFPIDGLGFDDSGVTFGDIPFSQASSAEQLRVSLAMAMALNPKLRVIRITDGSLLDSDNLALIQEMAEDNDYQIWIEKVDETGEIGVYIEDGQVKAKA